MRNAATWLGLLLLAIGIVTVVAETVRRRRERHARPDYVQRLREWYEQDAYGDEPTIAPANLPKVRPLKAERDRDRVWARLYRVK